MNIPSRRLRSWMFVPGNRQRFIDKALQEVATDAVFLDLEDGVPPPEKPAARKLLNQALHRPDGGPLRCVRINAVGSAWYDEDLAAIAVAGLQAICLPKVDDVDQVREVAARTDKLTHKPWIVVAIESARGLLRAADIAACHDRVLALILGAEDLALDLGLGTRREAEARELIYIRSTVVIAAAASHRLSIDGVFPDLEDPDGLLTDTVQARRLGFSGKSTFNPKQVDVINRVFMPSEDELAYARQVVAAFNDAQVRGDGSVAVGGQLVDLPIVERARRLLQTVESGN